MSPTIAARRPAAVDYERTLILSIEVSNQSWVLAAQVPGLPHTKAKRTVDPEAEALMAAIAGYRSRAAAMENQRLLLKTIRLDYFQSLPDQGVKHPLCYTIATFRARSDLVCVGDDGPVEAAGFELVHLMQTRQDSTPRGRVSNLCISEFELTETLSPGCRTRTCASRCGSWSGSAALILMHRFESCRPSQPVRL